MDLILDLATGYWNSATLLAANRLRIFDLLAEGSQTAAQVAERLNADLRGITMLLDACVGLELLVSEHADDQVVYRNSPASEACLVSGRPGYLGGAIQWGADQYPAWGQLASAVQSGQPAVPPQLHLGEDPEQTRTFVLGMHNRALGMARGVLHFLDLECVHDLLDVGGGPGTYATLLAQKYPNLHATVLDLPGIVEVARELVAQSPAADRVLFRPGDAIEDDYGVDAHDAVLFSGVLHQMNAETIQNLFAKTHRALRPGGRILISDIMLDADKTHPVFATLFSLQMLLTSHAGAVFSDTECRNWLEAAGFQQIVARPLPPPLPYKVVTGKKLES